MGRDWSGRMIIAVSLCLANLGACNESGYEKTSDEALIAKANTLPLDKRYDFYIDVYKATFPHRTAVSESITKLGQPAWDYTIKRAISGSYFDILSAIPVINSFKRNCSEGEYSALRNAAMRSTSDQNAKKSLLTDLATSCGR